MQPMNPSRFVQSLGDRAIAVLTNEGYSAGDRKARYRNLLDEGFAVNTIGPLRPRPLLARGDARRA